MLIVTFFFPAATQLSRPEEYIRMDEEIGQRGDEEEKLQVHSAGSNSEKDAGSPVHEEGV